MEKRQGEVQLLARASRQFFDAEPDVLRELKLVKQRIA